MGSNSQDRLPFSPGPSCPPGASVQQPHPGCPGLWGRGGGRGPLRPPDWRGPGPGQGSPEQDQGRQVIRIRVANGPGARRPEGHLRAGLLQSAGAQPDSRGRCLGRSRDKSRMGGCLGPLLNRGAPFPRCWLLILGAGPATLACRDAQGDPARWSGVHVPRTGCTWLSTSGTGVLGTLFETCVSPRSLAYKEHPGCLCVSQHFPL